MLQQDIDFLVNKTIKGWDTTDKFQLFFFAMVLGINARRVLELGVRDGNSTVPFLLAAEEIDGTVHSVDLEPTIFNCAEHVRPRWTFTQSDAIKFLEDCVANNQTYDLIYVDDWHSYAHVKRELELIDQMATPETVILIHDLMYDNSQPHYHMELNTTDAQWAEGGPYRAVSELDLTRWEWSTIPVNHGMTLLRKKSNKLRIN